MRDHSFDTVAKRISVAKRSSIYESATKDEVRDNSRTTQEDLSWEIPHRQYIHLEEDNKLERLKKQSKTCLKKKQS